MIYCSRRNGFVKLSPAMGRLRQWEREISNAMTGDTLDQQPEGLCALWSDSILSMGTGQGDGLTVGDCPTILGIVMEPPLLPPHNHGEVVWGDGQG